MTDKYAQLRAALAAGPTPGPWEVDEHYVQQQGRPEIGICDVLNMDEGGPKGWYRGPKTAANLALIAAAHPETIRALLAERDDLLENGKQAIRWAPSSAHWSNELRRLFGEDAREGIDALEAQLRAAQAERDALREALLREADWHDDEARAHKTRAKSSSGVYDGLKAEWHQERAQHIRAALAQEQGEPHDNQD